jgi:hypothetical protein
MFPYLNAFILKFSHKIMAETPIALFNPNKFIQQINSKIAGEPLEITPLGQKRTWTGKSINQYELTQYNPQNSGIAAILGLGYDLTIGSIQIRPSPNKSLEDTEDFLSQSEELILRI